MAERINNPEQLAKIETAKEKFRGDYVNEFVGVELFLQGLHSGIISFNDFRNECEQLFKRNKNKLILKFSERYDHLPVPEFYEKEIVEIDEIVDEINLWTEDFLHNSNREKLSILTSLVEKGINIIKQARVRY